MSLEFGVLPIRPKPTSCLLVDRFVSSLCVLPSQPEILVSGGGDPNLLVHNWQTGHLLRQIPILPTLSPFRTVRSAMRRGGKRVREALRVEEEELIAQGQQDKVDQLRKATELALQGQGVKMEHLTAQEWTTPIRGYVLPEGDGLCVANMQVVHENLVFYSEGCSSLHTVPIEHIVAPVSVLSAVHSHQLPYPVLDFCPLPIAPPPTETTTTSNEALDPPSRDVLVSLDPAWKYRQDGGQSFFPSQGTNAWTKSKRREKRQKKEANKSTQDAVAMDTTQDAAKEEAEGPSAVEMEQIKASPLRVLRIHRNGAVSIFLSIYSSVRGSLLFAARDSSWSIWFTV